MRLALAAAFDWRTLSWLGAGILASAVLSNPFPMLVGLGLYIWAIQRLVGTPAFLEAAERARVAQELSNRYRNLQAASAQVTAVLAKDRHWLSVVVETVTNGRIQLDPRQTWYDRSVAVSSIAREIYQEWLRHPTELQHKTPVVDQALQLAYHYLRVLHIYHGLERGNRVKTLEDARRRLARNEARLAQSTDPGVRAQLNRAADMDRKVLSQAAEKELERDRYLAKMAAIESTLEVLKRQVLDPASDGAVERVQELLQEAEAMDEAMQEVQRRTRVR